MTTELAPADADRAPGDARQPLPGFAEGRVRARLGWRAPTALAAFIVLGAVVIALLAPPIRPNPYLDPGNSLPDGASALFDLLGERGHQVNAVYSPGDALSAIGSASGSPSVTLLVTRPDLLTRRQLRTLSSARADLVVVGPGPKSTLILAPQLGLASVRASTARPVSANCQLPAAVQAGPADFAGETFIPPPGASSCYPISGYPSLVRYATPRRTITLLGDGMLLSNALLARQGNAALALNLLSERRQIVWLTPEPAIVAALPPNAPAPPGSSGPPLIPWTAWLVVLQLGVAVLLAAVWRARRFGPLITEPLPVVVRASETIEGHGRLYLARRATSRAGTQLREAMLARLLPALGLPAGSSEAVVISELASRSALSQERIAGLLYGPAPGSDADLVNLASGLDELERQVRAR